MNKRNILKSQSKNVHLVRRGSTQGKLVQGTKKDNQPLGKYFHSKYLLSNTRIGNGSNGIVKMAKTKSGVEVAVKIIKISPRTAKYLLTKDIGGRNNDLRG